ncbi:MAG: RsmD family RNA methyltransferase [Planctomycetota bacterium]
MAKRRPARPPNARSAGRGAKNGGTSKGPRADTPVGDSGELRIIGGRYRGTRLTSEPFVHATGPGTGELITRPMKHRVREAIFNLVGMEAEGTHAVDLFAGTGALGLEALSRGAAAATFIERHVPTAGVVRTNLDAVGVADRCELLVTSAFVWRQRDLVGGWPTGSTVNALHRGEQFPPPAERPWLVFVSPPYAFFVERAEEMLALVSEVTDAAPEGSLIVVEADERFDFTRLEGGVRPDRHSAGWDVRGYPPAVVGVWRKARSTGESAP